MTRAQKRKLPNEPEEPIEGEGDVSTYHVGGGWYEINGEKVQGKDNALDLLKDDENEY